MAFELLDPERESAAHALRERISAARQIREALETSARLEERGELFGALEALRSLPSGGPELLERERWLRTRLASEFQLQVEPVDSEAARLASRWNPVAFAETGCWLSRDGLLYLARCEGRRLFITEVELRSGRAVRQATLVAPGLISHAEHWVDERSLWFANAGAVLQLDRSTFEPLRWKTTAELVVPGASLEVVLPVPGSELVWVCYRAGVDHQRGAVWEAGRWREVRRVDEQPSFKTLVYGEPPEVLMSDLAMPSSVAGARGTPVTTLLSGRDWRVHAAARHPTHPGFVVLLKLPADIGIDPIELAVLDPPHGLGMEPLKFEPTQDGGIAALAVSKVAKMAYVLFDSEEGRS